MTMTSDQAETTTEAEARLARFASQTMEGVLGQPFRVLDDGFVRVVEYMGGDPSVVRAARVSYGAGTKRMRADRDLIRYLLRHHHWTPFEMAEIVLHVRVPMDTWRQWVRHRTASVNEYSTRYSEAIDAMQATPPGAWRLQSRSNRQGSDGYLPEMVEDPELPDGTLLTILERGFQEEARRLYRHRLDAGVAREQARKDLPLSTYTEAYWKIDLRNLLNFLALRTDPHAQAEIRQYAEVIAEIVQAWVPVTYGAFEDYVLEAVTFSPAEQLLIAQHLRGEEVTAPLLGRERDEFEEKLARLMARVAPD